MTDTPSHSQGVSVQVRGLRKSFDGQEVLAGLDFDVRPGEIFVIMGPSGSGKKSGTNTAWPWSSNPAPCSTR